jgi:hypothetical protein
MTKDNFKQECHIQPEMKILPTKLIYIYHTIRVATQIELHPNNISRMDTLILHRSWKLLVHCLKEQR